MFKIKGKIPLLFKILNFDFDAKTVGGWTCYYSKDIKPSRWVPKEHNDRGLQ